MTGSALQQLESEHPDLKTFLAEHHPGHDPVQIRNFIIQGEGITDWGAYRQACAEIHAHYTAARQAMLARQRLVAEIAVLDARRRLAVSSDDPVETAQARVLEVEQAVKQLDIELADQAFRRAAYELSVLVPLARELRARIAGKDPSAMMLEYHVERLKRLAVEQTLGPLGPVLQKASCLPQPARADVVAALESATVSPPSRRHNILEFLRTLIARLKHF